MSELDDFEHKLLASWEEVYKKGQLTMWIMVALHDGPKHMADIKAFIGQATYDTLLADDKSMYRALRRFVDARMLEFTSEASERGPDKKVYALTAVGRKVLAAFVDRNIMAIYYQATNEGALRATLQE